MRYWTDRNNLPFWILTILALLAGILHVTKQSEWSIFQAILYVSCIVLLPLLGVIILPFLGKRYNQRIEQDERELNEWGKKRDLEREKERIK